MHILIIGSGTREHCIAWKLVQSKQNPTISCFGEHHNPGILALSTAYTVGNIKDTKAVVAFAQQIKATMTIIGPEAPLATGVADALREVGIPTIGPKQQLAQLETSKSFTRNLMQKYSIDANPAFAYFNSMEGVEEFVNNDCHGSFVIKNDGLKGGKGVLVMGDHFQTVAEGLEIGKEIIEAGESFLIEEKIVGQEFSLISFSDGKTLAHTIPIQDHKRAFEGDTGPNTGGMGTYSDENHLLPFLTQDDIDQAQTINEQVGKALAQEFDDDYQGIIYGGFMITAHGIKVIEYNARFGDPEVFNILSLLKTDFVEICKAIVTKTLNQINISFKLQASVCKYLVPTGYPTDPIKGGEIHVGDIPANIDYFYGSVDQEKDKLITLGSRAIALIAHGANLHEAEQNVEQATQYVQGPLYHRTDIATEDALAKKVEMMKKLLEE